MHTPSSAARATGVAKSTIYRAIKSGRLCAHKLGSGKYAIYPAELWREFTPALPFARAADVTSPNTLSFPVWDVG
jgi:excisionase family DNA binding protein